MKDQSITSIHQLSQLYAYTSLQMHESIAGQAGLSGTDQKYLGFFITKGTMTAGELAVLTGLTTGAVTGLIDRFEKKKLVKRQFDKEDRRKVLIVPDTKKITALLEPLYKTFSTLSVQLIASFSDREQKTLITYFEKAIDLMTTTREELGGKQKPGL
ncbi:MarR family winged helix-turn-helix transcriptional regulator [Niabella hibiscisoli]|uniref:MarR family winged helix-turn-helix transcriptional regulator n=1 Tax=Niabella hibiscisoli TaxID=1825928 RepID=UPI001F1130AD|nr:MarR family transcriptional regulator [Niabella hibiscisoli]MCH5720165.1 MarR family transcriptional regulator [Niabella hibiscisoli]